LVAYVLSSDGRAKDEASIRKTAALRRDLLDLACIARRC
jgi:hypothetical protein